MGYSKFQNLENCLQYAWDTLHNFWCKISEICIEHSKFYNLENFPEYVWVTLYSDSKNPFHTNPKCGMRSALPYSLGILLSCGGAIRSTYPWLQDCSVGHVIWTIGCRDMINLKQQYHGKGIFTFEMKRVFVYYQYLV